MIKLKKPSWFKWHLFPEPKDKPIESVYEFLFYSFFLVVAAWLYTECNTVNYIEEEITLLSRNEYGTGMKNSKGEFQIPMAEIRFRQPMTNVKEMRGGALVSFRFDTAYVNKTPFWELSLFNDSALVNPKMIMPKIQVQYWDLLDSIIGKNRVNTALKPWYWNFSHIKVNADSLIQVFDSIYPSKYASVHKRPLYYFRSSTPVRRSFLSIMSKPSEEDTLKKTLFGTYYQYSSSEIKGGKRTVEYYLSGSEDQFILSIDPNLLSLGDPGISALEDISQAYYHFRINSANIDSIKLEIDFVGATEFSKMVPEPDEITMSSIKYTDPLKLLVIRKDGLLFHAKFVELENLQSVRMFFLTAVMSALFTVLLVFLVIALYKTFHKEEKEK